MMRTLPKLALAFVLASCGYHLEGGQWGLPPEVQSISVGKIENRSREYGLEKLFAFALEREIVARRQLRWEPRPERGDAVLTGTIRNLTVRPVAFNSRDEAMQYEVVLTVDLDLRRSRDGQVLWQAKGFRIEGEYASSPSVVVSSSAAFQQQPLDAANLRDPEWSPQAAADRQAVHLQLAESLKQQTLRALAQQAAQDLYAQMVENF